MPKQKQKAGFGSTKADLEGDWGSEVHGKRPLLDPMDVKMTHQKIGWKYLFEMEVEQTTVPSKVFSPRLIPPSRRNGNR